MRHNPLLAFTIFFILVFLLDFITYKVIKNIEIEFLKTKWFKITYWTVPVFVILSFILFFVLRGEIKPETFFPVFHTISGFFILMYVPKLFFLDFEFLQWLYFLIKHVIQKLRHTKAINPKAEQISRSQFLRKVGIAAAVIPFGAIIYGILWGRFNFIVRNLELTFESLPKEFDGFKVLQISDFHLGSFTYHKDKVKDLVEIINKQHADIVLFTGDFVNNVAAEAKPFIPILKKIKAKYGKFSVLGNHDYGDYVSWKTPEAKVQNLKSLESHKADMGFKLLLNETFSVYKGDSHIDLVGIHNWGLPPFPQYGDLNKALSTSDEEKFQILMSHDPSHWDAQVLEKTKVDLTLSGHTHGAQFGIEVSGWRWSPVNMRYKRWGGLYEEVKQKLFVNTGIGFIGFPGRVGIPPEIAVIELKHA